MVASAENGHGSGVVRCLAAGVALLLLGFGTLLGAQVEMLGVFWSHQLQVLLLPIIIQKQQVVLSIQIKVASVNCRNRYVHKKRKELDMCTTNKCVCTAAMYLTNPKPRFPI